MKNNQATFDQAYQMLNLVRETGVSLEKLQALYATGLLSDLLKTEDPVRVDRKEFRRLLGLEPLIFPVTVEYDQSLEEMVKSGKYDWTNSNINSKNFPINRRGTVKTDIVLVHFNRDMESEEVLRELDKQGLRPAEIPELLAFGAAYPEKQREFPIVALGSVWRYWGGGRRVAFLDGDADGRDLGLYCFDCWWFSDYRFAAVRK